MRLIAASVETIPPGTMRFPMAAKAKVVVVVCKLEVWQLLGPSLPPALPSAPPTVSVDQGVETCAQIEEKMVMGKRESRAIHPVRRSKEQIKKGEQEGLAEVKGVLPNSLP